MCECICIPFFNFEELIREFYLEKKKNTKAEVLEAIRFLFILRETLKLLSVKRFLCVFDFC